MSPLLLLHCSRRTPLFLLTLLVALVKQRMSLMTRHLRSRCLRRSRLIVLLALLCRAARVASFSARSRLRHGRLFFVWPNKKQYVYAYFIYMFYYIIFFFWWEISQNTGPLHDQLPPDANPPEPRKQNHPHRWVGGSTR